MSVRVGRWELAAVAAAVAVCTALMPTGPIARADTPSSPDDTVLDVVDSVLSDTMTHPGPLMSPPAPAAETPAVPGR
jgi:hypothetical protein